MRRRLASGSSPGENRALSLPCRPNTDHLGPDKPKHEARPNNTKNKENGKHNIAAQTFTFRELATATKNFRQGCPIGEGGFGRVYNGLVQKTGQVAAIKQLDRNGLQGNTEFLIEMTMLSLLHHENLVNLIGYCADGDQRLLVYEYMPLGCLDDHLLDLSPNQKPLDWSTRIKIALTTKSDVYSFGVVMLELITGGRAVDNMRSAQEQNVVTWANPIFKDQNRYPELADPLLRKDYPVIGLNQAVAVAAMCLNEDASLRLFMSDVVITLSFLAVLDSETANAEAVTSPLPEDNTTASTDRTSDSGR